MDRLTPSEFDKLAEETIEAWEKLGPIAIAAMLKVDEVLSSSDQGATETVS